MARFAGRGKAKSATRARKILTSSATLLSDLPDFGLHDCFMLSSGIPCIYQLPLLSRHRSPQPFPSSSL
jgi:hypothetical protein